MAMDGNTEEKLNRILDELQDIQAAFPQGPVKHREAHEAWMASKKAEEEFWRELKLDIAKKGIWGLLVIITGLILVGFATKLGIAFGGIK